MIDELLSLPWRQAKDDFERHYLVHHMGQCGGNISETAKACSMHRKTLQRRLIKLGKPRKKPKAWAKWQEMKKP
jgi:two-component system nitrogen regulation response regulator NtrX